jgi:multiple sugar transport system ATP-binding protein
MTLADRVAVMRKGVVQQIGSPRELYTEPVNLFVAGFIGSPSMNFLPAEFDGETLKLPIADVRLPDELRNRLPRDAPRQIIAGMRPEHFEDASLAGDNRQHGAVFRATVDVIEWMGSELYVYFEAAEGHSRELDQVASELGTVEVPRAASLVTARLDSESQVKEGAEAELWLDARQIILFDPESGRNLLDRELDLGNGASAARISAPDATAR